MSIEASSAGDHSEDVMYTCGTVDAVLRPRWFCGRLLARRVHYVLHVNFAVDNMDPGEEIKHEDGTRGWGGITSYHVRQCRIGRNSAINA